MNWWEPPSEVRDLLPAQRVGFGLACAEHILPSFDLQARAYPATVPPATLSPAMLHACVEALWAALEVEGSRLPECVTEEHALAAGSDEVVDGLAFLVDDAFAIVYYARQSWEDAVACVNTGQRALDTINQMLLSILVPHGTGYPDDEAVAGHPLFQLERQAQAEAVAGLTAGEPYTAIRAGARSAGEQIAATTASLLRSLA